MDFPESDTGIPLEVIAENTGLSVGEIKLI